MAVSNLTFDKVLANNGNVLLLDVLQVINIEGIGDTVERRDDVDSITDVNYGIVNEGHDNHVVLENASTNNGLLDTSV